MKKNAFTLVELLAVIAILAILIIIALPNILKMYNNAQMKLFLQEAKNINKAAEDSYMASRMNTNNPTETIYVYSDGRIESSTGNIDVNLTGHKPDGELIIKSTGETALAFHNGKYCARKTFSSSEITISKIEKSECTMDYVELDECFVTNADDVKNTSPIYGNVNGFRHYYQTYGSGEVAIYQYRFDNANCSSDVVIPSTINGKPVVAKEAGAFASGNISSYYINQERTIVSVYMPDTIRYIGAYAFTNNELTSLDIPDNVQSVGYSSFENNNISQLTLGNSLQTIDTMAFQYNNIANLVIPDSVTNIGTQSFAYGGTKTLVLGNSVQIVGSHAFYNNQLTSVTIPSSVTGIYGWAFANNRITQGNFQIDNSSGNIYIGTSILSNNGTNGNTTITPTYLK